MIPPRRARGNPRSRFSFLAPLVFNVQETKLEPENRLLSLHGESQAHSLSGSLSSFPEKPLTPHEAKNSLQTLFGYVVFTPRGKGNTFVWSDNHFFRFPVQDCAPKFLTPVVFTADFCMVVSRIGPDSLPVFSATFVRNCLGGEEPPPVEGFFTSCAEPKRATFHWNPSNQFSKKPFLISNSVENFPNLSFYKSCDVVFSVGRVTPYNLSPNPAFKKITVFSSEACPPPELIEPLTGSFSPEVLHSLCQAPLFNTHIVVGVPENAFVPSLSFFDFNFLNKKSALSWPAIEKKVHAKYLSLSKSAPEDGEEKNF